MLLQRGQGTILSGFLRILSCELLVSSCSSSVFEVFNVAAFLSVDTVIDSSSVLEAASGLVNSSVDCVGIPSSFFSSDGFSPNVFWIHENQSLIFIHALNF